MDSESRSGAWVPQVNNVYGAQWDFVAVRNVACCVHQKIIECRRFIIDSVSDQVMLNHYTCTGMH